MIRNSSRTTATLIGYHGYQNLGDDIFREVILRWLGERLGVKTCFVTARDDVFAGSRYGVSIIPFTNPLARISRFQWLQIFIRGLRSHYLVFGSGSIFSVQPFLLIRLVLGLLKAIRGESLKIVAIGISVGPFRTEAQKDQCLRVLAMMDCVLTRDITSSEILSKSKWPVRVLQSADISLCASFLAASQAPAAPRNRIGLVVTRRAFGNCVTDEGGPCRELLNALAMVNDEQAAEIRILCVCMDPTDGDAALSREFAHALGRRKIACEITYYKDGNLAEFLQAMKECAAVISSRLHGGVVAMLYGVPVFQVEYETKGRELARRCNLSDDFLRPAADLQSNEIARFLRMAREGSLQHASSSDRALLAECGSLVETQLGELANALRSSATHRQGSLR